MVANVLDAYNLPNIKSTCRFKKRHGHNNQRKKKITFVLFAPQVGQNALGCGAKCPGWTVRKPLLDAADQRIQEICLDESDVVSRTACHFVAFELPTSLLGWSFGVKGSRLEVFLQLFLVVSSGLCCILQQLQVMNSACQLHLYLGNVQVLFLQEL